MLADENVLNYSLSALQIGDRIVFEDQEGTKYYGIVRWIGKEESYFTGRQDYQVIGIQTVSDFSCIIVWFQEHALFHSPWRS